LVVVLECLIDEIEAMIAEFESQLDKIERSLRLEELVAASQFVI